MSSASPTPKPWWRTAGGVLTVVLAVFGLVMVAFAVLFFVALSQFGSNK